MRLKNLIISLILLFFSIQCIAQEASINIHKADSLFKVGDYDGAVEEYNIILKSYPFDKVISSKLEVADKARLLKTLSVKNKKSEPLLYLGNLLEILKLNPLDTLTKQDVSAYWAESALYRIELGRFEEAKPRLTESLKYSSSSKQNISLLRDLQAYVYSREVADSLFIAADYLGASVMYERAAKFLEKDKYTKFMQGESSKLYNIKQRELSIDSLGGIENKQKAIISDYLRTDVAEGKSRSEIPKYLLPAKQTGLRLGIGVLTLVSAGAIIKYNQEWKQLLNKTTSLSIELNENYSFSKYLEYESSLERMNKYRKNEVYRNVAVGVALSSLIIEGYLFKRYSDKKKKIRMAPVHDGLELKYNF